MLADLRFALRMLVKSPGFTAVAVLTLALAIGVNSAVFSLVHGVVLRPVIGLRPEEVVNLYTARRGAAKDYRQFSHDEYLALRGATGTFADVAAMNPVLTGIGQDGAVRRSFAFFVSDNYFTMLGTAPAAGRFFTAEESRPNSTIPVAVVSHALWQRHGGRADFVGGSLRINGQPHTVVGVARADFSGLNALLAPDVWLPFGQFGNFARAFSDTRDVQDLANPRNYTLNLTARLAPGVSLDALTARLPALAQRLDALQSAGTDQRRDLQFEKPSRFSISTEPSNDSSAGPLAVALFAMSGCVLLIACLNLANMFLARSTARTREFAVRLALGSARWQIVRQLLVEGGVLAAAGGVLGLLFALWSNELLLGSLGLLFSTMNFSLAVSATPNPAVLGTTFGLSLLATLGFALGPALRASRIDLVTDLKQQGGDDRRAGRLNRFFAPRHVLAMAQISLSLMLLFSAGLFVRSALRAGGAKLGFEPRGQVVAEIDYSLTNLPPADARRNYFAAVERVRALPGVQAAALGTQLPYGNITNMPRFVDARLPLAAPSADPSAATPGVNALLTAATPGWFDALGVTLLRGRDFTAAEAADENSPRVAILDETAAKALFPNDDALGQRIRFTQASGNNAVAEMEVIGICAPHRHDALHATDRKRVFVPFAQNYNANAHLHVRFASHAPATVAAGLTAVRSALRAADPAMPLLGLTPMTALLDRNIQLWIVRLGAALFGTFGLIALALAVVGVYGVKAYAVERRAREIGIRMALGAQPGEVLRLFLRQGLLQTALGLAVGFGLALGAGRMLASMLSRISAHDPASLLAAAAVLAASAALATWIPARRAVRVDPCRVLRNE